MYILDIAIVTYAKHVFGLAFWGAYRIIRLEHLNRNDGGVSKDASIELCSEVNVWRSGETLTPTSFPGRAGDWDYARKHARPTRQIRLGFHLVKPLQPHLQLAPLWQDLFSLDPVAWSCATGRPLSRLPITLSPFSFLAKCEVEGQGMQWLANRRRGHCPVLWLISLNVKEPAGVND